MTGFGPSERGKPVTDRRSASASVQHAGLAVTIRSECARPQAQQRSVARGMEAYHRNSLAEAFTVW